MQGALFHDSIYDAIAADVAAIGGAKKVAGMLWPTMDATSAHAKLRASLNPDQPHKLCVEELMRIKIEARKADSTATINYEARELGYNVEWLSPEDEDARLRREFVGAVEKLDRIRKDIGTNELRIAARR